MGVTFERTKNKGIMTKSDLRDKEFNEYYWRYIDKLPESINLREGFSVGKQNVLTFFNSIAESKWDYRYAPDKWTIKEVLQHLIDTERIFAYRMFRIARNDKTPLAPYDQNIYMEPSNANQKDPKTLIREFRAVRESSIALVDSLSDDALCTVGVSSDVPMSSRAAAFTIIGHEIWHMDSIKERYL